MQDHEQPVHNETFILEASLSQVLVLVPGDQRSIRKVSDLSTWKLAALGEVLSTYLIG